MSPNPDSILDSVKKVVGLDSTDTTFDLDITLFINSALGTLQQLGIGPTAGFFIADNTALWSGYTVRFDLLGMVKAFTGLSVKLAFDPPDSRFALPAFERQVEELKWRIVSLAETTPSSGWWDLTGLSDFPSGAVSGDFGFDSSTNSIYVCNIQSSGAYWWDLTGLSDFPPGAVIGEYGYDTSTGLVWRKTA